MWHHMTFLLILMICRACNKSSCHAVDLTEVTSLMWIRSRTFFSGVLIIAEMLIIQTCPAQPCHILFVFFTILFINFHPDPLSAGSPCGELCRKNKLYSVLWGWQHVLGSCQAAVALFYSTACMSRICLHLRHVRMFSAPKTVGEKTNLPHSSAVWHVIAELLAKAAILTLRRGTPVSCQKCFSLVMNVRCYELGKKYDGLFIKCWYGRVRRLFVEVKHFHLWQGKLFLEPTDCAWRYSDICPLPHVEVRTHTNVTHSATPSNHTYHMQPPLLNTFWPCIHLRQCIAWLHFLKNQQQLGL